MELIAYRFDCWPIYIKDSVFTDDENEEYEKAKANFAQRTEIIDKLFDAGDRDYALGDGSHAPFKRVNDLILRRYKPLKKEEQYEDEVSQALLDGDIKQANALRNMVVQPTIEELVKMPKSEYDSYHPARIIYHKDGYTVLRIQKKRPLEGEDKNYNSVIYKENYVSSLVILVSRLGCQFMLIENTRRTYSPATVSLIMESTLNRLLMTEYRMSAVVHPIRRLSDFWKQLNEMQQYGRQILKLRFKFDYQNMAWPDELMGLRFRRLGLDLDAEADIIIKGHHGAPLRLNTKEGERNEDVNDMARYSCDKGNKAYAYFDDGTFTTFGSQQTGDVKVMMSDKIGEVQNNTNPELFPTDLTDAISEKVNTLKVMNT